MASRLLRKIMGLNQGQVIVAGSFAVNGSSAISAASNKGVGWSVAYTSTGLYTLTFTDKYPKLFAICITPQLTSADDKIIFASDYSATAGTLLIRTWDISGAALADLAAANANNRINFIACFGNLSFQ